MSEENNKRHNGGQITGNKSGRKELDTAQSLPKKNFDGRIEVKESFSRPEKKVQTERDGHNRPPSATANQ